MTAASSSNFTGLIPAHAGSTRSGKDHVLRWGAHPRSRGEHGGLGCEVVEGFGSSPLTRGAR